MFGPDGAWLLGAGGAGNGFLVFLDLKAKKVVKEEAVKFHVHRIVASPSFETIHLAGHNGYAAYAL